MAPPHRYRCSHRSPPPVLPAAWHSLVSPRRQSDPRHNAPRASCAGLCSFRRGRTRGGAGEKTHHHRCYCHRHRRRLDVGAALTFPPPFLFLPTYFFLFPSTAFLSYHHLLLRLHLPDPRPPPRPSSRGGRGQWFCGGGTLMCGPAPYTHNRPAPSDPAPSVSTFLHRGLRHSTSTNREACPCRPPTPTASRWPRAFQWPAAPWGR